MKNLPGSYTFDRFSASSQTKEFQRLYRQAQILATIDQEIYAQAGLGEGMTVLDVGCGVGAMTSQLAAQVGKHGRVLGIDGSHELLAVAQANHGVPGVIDFQWGDICALPLPDRSVDFVYARLLFQHLADPLLALAEVRRVLRPGGRVCIVDVAEGWFALDPEPAAFRSLREYLRAVQADRGGNPKVGQELGSDLTQSGFRAVTMGVRLVTSDELGGIDRFGQLLSFGSPYDAPADLVLEAKQQVVALGALPYAWAAFGLFVARGEV
jgi:SAM-dependent methyltransferase